MPLELIRFCGPSKKNQTPHSNWKSAENGEVRKACLTETEGKIRFLRKFRQIIVITVS